ncbi:hypothetical protein L0128_03230 [candidate division KSB1 bacterium]|nr:hypothetical protein [candidate division KSB1 bacterium]
MATEMTAATPTWKFLLRVVGTTLAVLVVGLMVIHLFRISIPPKAIIYGYIASVTIFLISLGSIQLVRQKSLKAFMLTVVGGMFLRFLCIITLIFIFMRYLSIDIKIFLGSFIIFYLICQVFEIRLIHASLPKRKP